MSRTALLLSSPVASHSCTATKTSALKSKSPPVSRKAFSYIIQHTSVKRLPLGRKSSLCTLYVSFVSLWPRK